MESLKLWLQYTIKVFIVHVTNIAKNDFNVKTIIYPEVSLKISDFSCVFQILISLQGFNKHLIKMYKAMV